MANLNVSPVTYLEILKLARDPLALRVGIIWSELFPEEVKERARRATTLDALRLLIDEQRSTMGAA